MYWHCSYNTFLHLECQWKSFNSIVKDEGNYLSYFTHKSVEDCQKLCDQKIADGCNSFGYCPGNYGGTCYLHDKILDGSEPQTSRTDCNTNYKKCHGKCVYM